MSQTDNFAYKEQLMDIVHDMGSRMYIPQLVQHFDKSMIYSTDEKRVGCWIDGRPLYQKTIEFTMPTNTDVKTILTLGSTYKVIKIDGIEHPTDGGAIEIPWCLNTSANNWTFVFQDLATGNICVNIGENVAANFKGCSAYVTILYYKTTDAANSFKWADENDYSTTEKIVGTDENGDYVWQKTFICTCPTVTTDGTQVDGDVPNSSITNLKEVKEIRGIIIGGVSYQPLPIVVGGSSNKILGVRLIYNYSPTTKLSISSSWTAYNGKTIKATLQYTKTTD